MKSFMTAFLAGSMMVLGICIYSANKAVIDNSLKKFGCKQFKSQTETPCHNDVFIYSGRSAVFLKKIIIIT